MRTCPPTGDCRRPEARPAAFTPARAQHGDTGKADGGALASVEERFVSQAAAQARESGLPAEAVIRQRLAKLTEMTGGYDFADVVARYWQGHDTGDEQLTSAAVRWLRGEFTTRTDARAALGVRTIIDDA